MKDSLIFDTTDANTIADSDNVGAYLRSSDGTLLTHTDVGGKQALDVRLAEGVNVEVDLDAGDDSVAAWLNDGSGNAINSTAGSLDVNLTNANIEVTQGTSPWVVSADGGSFAVTATDFDIRDLSASQDNIAISDGTDTLAIEADGSINVNIASIDDAALADTSIASGATTQATANSSVNAVASALANRKYLFLYNNDNRKMFVGPSGVTAANGFPVSPSSYIELRAGASVDIEFVSEKAGHELRYLELS
jgi:hypothetical protein